jgi:arabinoxylan arabinofuranohydrolase
MPHTCSWRTNSTLSLLLLSTLASCSSDDSGSSDVGSGGNGEPVTSSGGAPGATGGTASDGVVSPPTNGMGEGIGPVQLDGAGGAGTPGAMPTPGDVLPSTCTPVGKARNPLVSHIFTADPNAVVYGDRVYLYVSHDVDGQDNYDMVDYRGFSSDDMVNWQDHGVLIHSDDVAWADNLYAPGACQKNGKFYLYMPNGGSSIGVAVADNPGGPFVDPRGTALVTRDIPGVADVDWLFDPACFVDEDGQGYLYFGGGPEGTGDNGRVMRLNDDMISLRDTQATTIPIPAFFEAAHMHKRAGTYYLQYSSDFSAGHGAALEYMTSTSPMTGFAFRGVILPNAGINNGNNNHGSIVELAGTSYLFYHARKLQQELGVNKVNNRSVAVQAITYGADGSINPITMSTENTTVDQIKCLDGFAEVQAETLAAESGIEVEGLAGGTVRVAQIAAGDWVGYSQVDFRSGATTLVARVASAAGGGVIDVRIDGCDDFTSVPGSSIGTCQVVSTGGADTYADLSCSLAQTSGAHDLCLSFSGDTSFTIDSWHLE